MLSSVGSSSTIKFFWAPVVDGCACRCCGRLGRASQLDAARQVGIVIGLLNIAQVESGGPPRATVVAALLVGVARRHPGHRHRCLAHRDAPSRMQGVGPRHVAVRLPHRIWSAAGAVRAVVAAASGWSTAYIACAAFARAGDARPDAARRRTARAHACVTEAQAQGLAARSCVGAVVGPFIDFFARYGALARRCCSSCVHKLGDTLADLTIRLLFNDLRLHAEARSPRLRRAFGVLGLSSAPSSVASLVRAARH